MKVEEIDRSEIPDENNEVMSEHRGRVLVVRTSADPANQPGIVLELEDGINLFLGLKLSEAEFDGLIDVINTARSQAEDLQDDSETEFVID